MDVVINIMIRIKDILVQVNSVYIYVHTDLDNENPAILYFLSIIIYFDYSFKN